MGFLPRLIIIIIMKLLVAYYNKTIGALQCQCGCTE